MYWFFYSVLKGFVCDISGNYQGYIYEQNSKYSRKDIYEQNIKHPRKAGWLGSVLTAFISAAINPPKHQMKYIHSFEGGPDPTIRVLLFNHYSSPARLDADSKHLSIRLSFRYFYPSQYISTSYLATFVIWVLVFLDLSLIFFLFILYPTPLSETTKHNPLKTSLWCKNLISNLTR